MYDFNHVEQEAQELWDDIDLLEKIEAKNEGGETYWLLDGPPYANNVPHSGHMKTTAIKDLYIRLAMQEGKDVWFKPGFDTHGLPIENMVEQELGLESVQEIEELGVQTFVDKCRESATKNKDEWLEYYDQLGSLYSKRDPYLTYDNSYLESAWWAFKQQWDAGMVYEGKRPVHWCPHCQTALAGYEVTDSYKQVTDPGVYVKFKLKDADKHLLVFTTTPWTLPSNTAIFVQPDATYVEVDTVQGTLIFAKEQLDLLDDFGMDGNVLREFPGEELVGEHYQPLIDVPVQEELEKNPNALQVYPSIPILQERVASKVSEKKGVEQEESHAEFVTVEEGTGLVHTAPGHGKTDNMVGEEFDLPAVSPLNDACEFTDDVGMWQGEFVKDADPAIMQHLDRTGKLVHHEEIQHKYPLCWRCKNPLIFRMSNQWFLKVDHVKNAMLEENEDVNWQPEFARKRFRNWVADAEDWNISRQRYWGIPMPVWKNSHGEIRVISSEDELREAAIDPVPDDFDLHAVDEIRLEGDEEPLERVSHIFDVWYDSGCAPFASMGYPYENEDRFEKHYPVDRISESQDQIRGWFYHLMFNNTSLFDEKPFETVSMPGWVLDEKGDKMSKSVGNVVWADDAIAEVGADAVRFYFCWDKAPYNTTKFSLDTIKDEVHKFLNIYWNLHEYVQGFDIEPKEPDYTTVEDEWIRSRCNTMLRDAIHALKEFELHDAGEYIYEFIVEDLSRTYIHIVRDRVQHDAEPVHVVRETLLNATSLLAAITPHVTEHVYQNLRSDDMPESVHLTEIEHGNSDPELEHAMAVTQDIIAAVLSARDKAGVGVRWPLSQVTVETDEASVEEALRRCTSVLEEQCNVRDVTIGTVEKEMKAKPDYSTIGPEFEDDADDVAHAIESHADDIARAVQTGKERFELHGYELTSDHLTVTEETPERYATAKFTDGVVYVDTEVSDELEREGYVNEITRRVQQLRKDAGLDKDERIELYVQSGRDGILDEYAEDIKERVGAVSVETDGRGEYEFQDEIGEHDVIVSFDLV